MKMASQSPGAFVAAWPARSKFTSRLIHWLISTLRPAAPPHHGVRRALIDDAPPDQRIKV